MADLCSFSPYPPSGVTTVLSMTTLGFGGRSAWPSVSYATALDYFVILCFAYVFAAVLEFAMINFIERAANKRRKKIEDLKKTISERMMVCLCGRQAKYLLFNLLI